MKLSPTKSHSVAAAVAGLAVTGTAVATALGWRELPPPFVWLDVATVCFVAALPLAATLATAALFQLPRRASTIAVLLIELVAFLFIPRLYIHARCQRDLNEAVQLSGDSRYGEARALLRRVLALAPNAEWNGTSASQVARYIEEIVQPLERRIASPLPENATREESLERAGLLAVLGRTDEALLILASPALAESPQVHNLRGLIHETQGQWRLARDSYLRSKAAWQLQPDSPSRSSGLQDAMRGIAYSQRKLGRLNEAEEAWQELLALSPTAETHVLLARFYEDTQQAAQADFHARQAALLAPQNNLIQNQARQLQNKLLTSHFGCLGIVSEQWTRPSTPLQMREHRGSGEGLTK